MKYKVLADKVNTLYMVNVEIETPTRLLVGYIYFGDTSDKVITVYPSQGNTQESFNIKLPDTYTPNSFQFNLYLKFEKI